MVASYQKADNNYDIDFYKIGYIIGISGENGPIEFLLPILVDYRYLINDQKG